MSGGAAVPEAGRGSRARASGLPSHVLALVTIEAPNSRTPCRQVLWGAPGSKKLKSVRVAAIVSVTLGWGGSNSVLRQSQRKGLVECPEWRCLSLLLREEPVTGSKTGKPADRTLDLAAATDEETIDWCVGLRRLAYAAGFKNDSGVGELLWQRSRLR